MHLFYYGTWLMGLLSLFSVMAIYRSNKRVIRDMKNISGARDKWLQSFILEHQRFLKENSTIQNPAVYLTKRLRGRKIGPISLRAMKGISWYTFILSFLFAGAGIFSLQRTGTEVISFPVISREFPSTLLLAVSAAGTGIVLLLLRMVLAMGYQEEIIETNLLDYMENENGNSGKVISMETSRQTLQGQISPVQSIPMPPQNVQPRKMSKKARAKARAQEQRFQEQKIQEQRIKEQKAQEERVREERERNVRTYQEQEKERKAEKVEERIREAAATNERYSHLLNKEEEAIVKDVIKEFLT